MQDEDNQPPNMDAQIRKALTHPKRTEIFGYLIREKDGTSEGELADEFDMGIPLVTYHLKVLHDADLIVRVEGRDLGNAGYSYIAAASTGL